MNESDGVCVLMWKVAQQAMQKNYIFMFQVLATFDFISNLIDDAVMYGTLVCQVGIVQKPIFITWVGPSVGPLLRGRVSMHKQGVQNFFSGCCCEIFATSVTDLDSETMCKRLTSATGENFVSVHKLGMQSGNLERNVYDGRSEELAAIEMNLDSDTIAARFRDICEQCQVPAAQILDIIERLPVQVLWLILQLSASTAEYFRHLSKDLIPRIEWCIDLSESAISVDAESNRHEEVKGSTSSRR